MAYEHILYDKDSPVVITLNRPDALIDFRIGEQVAGIVHRDQ